MQLIFAKGHFFLLLIKFFFAKAIFYINIVLTKKYNLLLQYGISSPDNKDWHPTLNPHQHYVCPTPHYPELQISRKGLLLPLVTLGHKTANYI